MQRVMLLNPKGGSGKTTIATSVAGYFAARRERTVIIDHDAQGSSTRWLRVRPGAAFPIEGVAAFENPTGVTRAWQMRVPPETQRVVVDTPAGVRAKELIDLIRRADCIVIPVLPSHIDIDAVSAFVEDLRQLEPVREGATRVAVVANRVRARTVIFQELEDFLDRLGFPFIAKLRESQNYLRAAERGLGVHELRRTTNRVDRLQWAPLLAWLDGEPLVAPPPEEDRSDARRDTYPLPL